MVGIFVGRVDLSRPHAEFANRVVSLLGLESPLDPPITAARPFRPLLQGFFWQLELALTIPEC